MCLDLGTANAIKTDKHLVVLLYELRQTRSKWHCAIPESQDVDPRTAFWRPPGREAPRCRHSG
eukprot:1161603-Pyramimonas_sp.AAC.1